MKKKKYFIYIEFAQIKKIKFHKKLKNKKGVYLLEVSSFNRYTPFLLQLSPKAKFKV